MILFGVILNKPQCYYYFYVGLQFTSWQIMYIYEIQLFWHAFQSKWQDVDYKVHSLNYYM